MGHWWVTLTNQLYFVYVHLSTFSHRSACASVMSHLSSVSVPVMFYLCSVYISFSFCLRSSYIFSFLSTFSLCFSHIPVMSHLCCVFLWSPFCLRSNHAPVVGYLSNFATRFQKFLFSENDQKVKVERFHFYLKNGKTKR